MVDMIPSKINNYNVYDQAERLLGMGDEMTLPDFESTSNTISGSGLLGEIDDPAVGHFGNMEVEVPFRMLGTQSVNMLDNRQALQLTIRGAAEAMDAEGNVNFQPIRVVMRGRSKKLSGGKMKLANPMDTSVTLSLTYILIEVSGQRLIELDKLNQVFKIKDEDVLAKVKEML